MGTGNKEQGLGTWQETASEGGYYITGAPHVNLVVNSQCVCVCVFVCLWVCWYCCALVCGYEWLWFGPNEYAMTLTLLLLLFSISGCWCFIIVCPVKKVIFSFSFNLELLVFASIFPFHICITYALKNCFHFMPKKKNCTNFFRLLCVILIFLIVLIGFWVCGFLKICCWNALLTLLKFF